MPKLVFEGRGSIEGQRTNCFSGETYPSVLTYKLFLGYDYKLWFRVEPGVTGHESCPFDKDNAKRLSEGGWLACMGTARRWDKLWVPPEEMARAVKDLVEILEEARL